MPDIKSIVTPFISDRVMQQTTDKTKQLAQQNANVLISNGVQIKDIVVNGQTDVSHGLGRSYNGYFVTLRSANQNIWDLDSGMKDKILRLTSAGSVTVTLWVF